MRNNIDFEKLKKARSFIDYYPEYEILEDLHLENDVYEYIEESYDHNEVSWRFAFNYFMDVYLRKCG